ncbi:E3 SUMO-protein ligase KIAA1586-like [Aphis gossypii]|uniref:E3 SUMO-protein ligase KIAA1586-like n=1 Tax=Aphis gossypii TaxID=80765 RepID=UPI0021595153|nr:E3 SUMO-protein ligase KIAA1586-like [Aphis gossypii]
MSGLLKYSFTKTKVINNDNNINNSEINPNITKQNIVTNETSLDDDHGTKEMQFESDTEFPDCWDLKQCWKVCIKQNLLDHKGSHVSSEWINAEVYPSGSSLEKKKTNLRKKIAKHKSSIAHLNAQKIVTESEKNVMDEHIFKIKAAEHESTARIFRTAYSIAKYQRPYTDLPKMTDLQILNGLDMGRVLQIDESTTLSKKSMLVICLRCAVGEPDDIYTFLFDIVEIPNASAMTIKEYILKSLVKFGINYEFLKKNLISFVSDGASNMLGRKAGVGVLLQKMFPNIILWHCCNHRLELGVSDCLKEVNGVNHFQSFIENLYSLYHMSPKNTTELKECANSLDKQLLRIGILYDGLTELSDLSIELQKRDQSFVNAHKSIERTIRVLNSMANTNGPRNEEVSNACKIQMFKANNLKQRLFTTQSTKVSSVESNDPSRDIFNNLLADLDMISPNNWPDSCDIQYGDTSIRRLSKIFKVDEQASVRGFREYKDFPSSLNDNIKPLMNAVKTLAISSAECERSFSSMNEIVSSKRSLLTSDHISSLAFINCTGPPVNNFKPLPYIKTWLVSGKRSAIEENCPKRLKVNDKTYKSIWSCLEK